MLNGTSVPLRIDDVKTDADGTVLYSVAVLSDNGPMSLCGTANGVPVPAVVVSGYWDKAASYVDEDDSFTFGCVNAAIGKCVRWGYKPWTTAQECRNNSCKTRKLSDWHRACVRLVRADYCGDGVSHTRNGTIINVYDQIGIQKSSQIPAGKWKQSGEPTGRPASVTPAGSRPTPSTAKPISPTFSVSVRAGSPQTMAALRSRQDDLQHPVFQPIKR